MANMTLSIPDGLYRKMRLHPEYRWSEVARQAIEEKLSDAELLADLRSIAKAEKERKAGRTISHKELIGRLGLGNGI